MAELVTAVDQSKYVETNKITVAEFVRRPRQPLGSRR
jgi:hypothetical protein